MRKREDFMARKTQISKELILETAFRLLVRDGESAVNIKSLAREIGCSTQPIAWHFGNMEGFRTEFLDYCVRFLGRIFCGIKSKADLCNITVNTVYIILFEVF